MCLYLFPYTIRSYLLMLGGFGAGVWTSMVPGFTDPAGFVTAAQAVHVISPLETDRLQVPGIRETRQLHSRALSYLFVKGSRISLRKKMEDTKKIVVETLELEKNAVFFCLFVKGFACGCFWKCCKGHFNLCCFYMPGSELPISGMVIPPLLRNPFNGYTNPYYWVEDNQIQSTMNIVYFVEIMAVSTPSPRKTLQKKITGAIVSKMMWTDRSLGGSRVMSICRDMSHVHEFWGSGNICGWMVIFKLDSLHLPSITMVSDIFPTQKKTHKASPSNHDFTGPQTANQKTQLLAVVPNCLYHYPLANKKKRKLELKKKKIYIYI